MLLNPLVEELLCAIATKGDGIKVFPGLEAFANVEYVLEEMKLFLEEKYEYRVSNSLRTLDAGLRRIVEELRPYRDEIDGLVKDLDRIRGILGHRNWSGKRVRAEVRKWVKMLRSRLRRRKLENDPAKLKSVDWRTTTPATVIWQEWIRLHHTHEHGLYIAYDQEIKAFTNNPLEWEFRAGRYHYRKLNGRGNIGKSYIVHGKYHCRVSQLDLTEPRIKQILEEANWENVEHGLESLRHINRRARRPWRIRKKDTGNMKRLEERLSVFMNAGDFVD